jgi:hypothetical protein
MHEGKTTGKYVFSWEFIACAYKLPKKRAEIHMRRNFPLGKAHGGIISEAFWRKIVSLVFWAKPERKRWICSEMTTEIA